VQVAIADMAVPDYSHTFPEARQARPHVLYKAVHVWDWQADVILVNGTCGFSVGRSLQDQNRISNCMAAVTSESTGTVKATCEND
jgi:hypothetical protein